MALQSKTIDGSTVHSSWDFKLEVVENSINNQNNNSSVTVTPYIGRIGSSSYMTGAEITCDINVTGCKKQTISNMYTTGTIDAGSWYSLGSKTFTVPHNEDGTKKVTISSSFTNDVNPNSGSASGEMTLTTIDQYIKITSFTVLSVTKDSITCEWITDGERDWTQYSINNGEWTDAQDTTGNDNKSGTFTIKNLTPETTYSIKVKVRKTGTGLWTTSSAIEGTTLKDNVIRLKINNTWKEAIPYVKANGVWKEATPYIKVNGVWKEGV